MNPALRCATVLLAAGPACFSQAATLADPELATALASGEERRVIVQLREDGPPPTNAAARASARVLRERVKAQVLARLPAARMTLRHAYGELPAFAATLRDGAGLQQLLADPRVAVVFADRVLRLHLTQSLPLLGQPTVANVMGRQGAGTTVAVLDTGVDYTRSELGGCTAPGTPSSCRVVAAYEAATEDNARDADGHGTLVAMTAAATAGQARIAALDVFTGDGAYASDIIEAINWAIANRAQYNIVALNMSLGDGAQNASACSNPFTDPFVQPVRNARNAGIVVIAASGNEAHTNGISSPACVSEAVAVGAVYDANVGQVAWSACTDTSTAADRVTCFSSSGAPLDLLAPGALVTVGGSTVGGTSFAAPLVAGAVAVLKGAFGAETPTQTEARLLNGEPVSDPRNGLVRPRLNLLRAQGAPANDSFAAAIALSGSGGTSAWNHNASAQSGEPAHAGVVGGRSVWWRWTAPGDGRLQLNTAGSAIDTLLAVYEGSAVNALTPVVSNDNAGGGLTTSALSAAVVAGRSYRIAVDGKAGAQGALSLAHAFAAASADLGLGLASAPEPATVGGTVSLSAAVSNAGPDAAQAVALDLLLPARLGAPFVLPAGCSQASGAVNCNLGTMNSGEARTVVVQATALTAGQATVSARLQSTTADPDNGNNAADVVATLVSGPGGDPGGGDTGGDSDVPLPGWALAALGAALLAAGRRARRLNP